MAYKKGDLQKIVPCPTYSPDFGCDCLETHHARIFDSRDDDYEPLKSGVFLPHSCDAWVIGGPENIRQLIADLEEALAHGNQDAE